MTHPDIPHDFYVDANGLLTEVADLDGVTVHMHYDDVPESDVTVVDGLRCATPLRAVLDVAGDCDWFRLERLVDECLQRRMFTVDEALRRIAQPDMAERLGARRVAQVLRDRRR